jgi:hypothetical protein
VDPTRFNMRERHESTTPVNTNEGDPMQVLVIKDNCSNLVRTHEMAQARQSGLQRSADAAIKAPGSAGLRSRGPVGCAGGGHETLQVL